VRVPLPVAEKLSGSELQWIVPGMRAELIGVLLRALPKSLRKDLMPLEPKAGEIVREFRPEGNDFLASLAEFITRKYRIGVRADDWRPDALPAHLRPRVEVVDRNNRTVATGRDLQSVRSKVEDRGVSGNAWSVAERKWERRDLKVWNFGDLPESVPVEDAGGVTLLAYPGLVARENAVDIRLFRKRGEAEQASRAGVRRLSELESERDVTWLKRELRALGQPPKGGKRPANFTDALSAFGQKLQPSAGPKPSAAITPEALQAAAYRHIVEHLFNLEPVFPLTKARFDQMLQHAHRELPMTTRRVIDLTSQILALREQLIATTKRYPTLDQDLQRLVPADFLARTPHAQLEHLPRYLRAMQIRGERAFLSPAKDAEKAKQFAPFIGWETKVPEAQREAFRWLLEEFRVSVFAQELGTAQPVSAQRLKTLGGL